MTKIEAATSSNHKQFQARSAVAKLSVKEAARHLGISKSLLDKLRMLGRGPQFIKIGSRVLYDIDDLESWVRSHKRCAE
jgi:predicted DNA-binding transcriptional regulator AlpA